MVQFILRRIAIAIPTLLIISFLIFLLQVMLPGDPALALAGEDPSPQAIAAIREKFQLDQPIPMRYLTWVANVLQGDFGMSIRTGLPVRDMLIQRLPVTFQLALMAMILAVLIAIPGGIIAALRPNSPLDYTVSSFTLAGVSVPNFFLGIMLILLFSVTLGWLPSGGYVPFASDPLGSIRSLIMPSIVLAFATSAVLMSHTRSAMLGTLNQDYIRTARAKGVSEPLIVIKHALRNALIPIITLGTIQFGELLGGAVLTEQVFGIPGFGKMLVDGVFSRDYSIVQAVVLVQAIIFLIVTVTADILYAVANPKLRHQ
ncbi:peptide ABC transporter [Devosia riboflavina]|uniref:Peptide ABC transporter n=1 Tax=Devosia riboflavina TaxID=46914 RepID=A0A087M2R3_9HYPH|nr:ABC transporter permease [Devosia riboflavina]KFL31166.1 peptide ABC transporter [Devosia riboflavina]